MKTVPWCPRRARDRLARVYGLNPFVTLLGPHLAPELVSSAALDDVAGAAAVLPARLAQGMFGLEVRLGDEPAAADFAVAARPGQGDFDALSRTVPEPDLRGNPGWAALARLASAWQSPESALHGALGAVWLEMDVSQGLRDPSLFFSPLTRGPGGAQVPAQAARIAAEGLEILLGEGLDPAIRRTLERCFAALPWGAAMVQAGVMTSRPDRSVRLCARLPSPETAVSYLDAIGYSGDTAQVAEVAGWPGSSSGYRALSLEIGVGVAPRIGVEHGASGGVEPRWPDLLEELRRHGVCTAAKSRALLAFPGQEGSDERPNDWPENVRSALSLLPGTASALVRRLHHVKVVCGDGSPLTAKAYLAAHHVWLRPVAEDGVTARGSGRESLS